MNCYLCERKIPRRDVDAGRYVRSRFTGHRYCLRDDCRAIRRRILAKQVFIGEKA